MKEFLAKPGFLGTHGTIGADVSYLSAVLFTALFLFGWYQAKKHKGNAHHGLTLWGMVTMLAYFTTYYSFRSLGVLALEGRSGFGGPDWVYDKIFTPTLTVHIVLVTFGIVIAIYLIVLGFRASVKENGKRFLKEEALHVKMKNFYITFLSILALLGLLAFIRCSSFRCYIVYLVGFLIVILVFAFEKIMEKALPDGATRHRILGKLTMIMYVLLLITSTITYLLLYIIYTPQIPEG